MQRHFANSSTLAAMGVCFILMIPATTAQPTRTIMPGKWNIGLYPKNSNYLQVIVDTRGVKPDTFLRGFDVTATLYAPNDRFLRTAKLSMPAQDLPGGKLYVFYGRTGAANVVKVYGISGEARVAIYPPGTHPPLDRSTGPQPRFYRGVTMALDRKIRLSPAAEKSVQLLTLRPPALALGKMHRHR